MHRSSRIALVLALVVAGCGSPVSPAGSTAPPLAPPSESATATPSSVPEPTDLILLTGSEGVTAGVYTTLLADAMDGSIPTAT